MKKITLLIALMLNVQLVCTSQIPNWQWAHSLQGAKDDAGKSIATDGDGNVIMFGDYISDSIKIGTTYFKNVRPTGGVTGQLTYSDIFLSKHDSAGNLLWAKTFGGDDQDIAYSVAVDGNDNIIITGKFLGDSLVIGSSVLYNCCIYQYDAFIAKLDKYGTPLWAKSIGGSDEEIGRTVCTDENNNIYWGGTFWSSTIQIGSGTYSPVGVYDIFLCKLSSNGNYLWTKTFGGSKSETIKDICSDKEGYIYFTGDHFSNDLTIGTLLTLMPDPSASSDMDDIYVTKMDVAGNITWSKTLNSISSENASGICIDKNKNVIITGSFSDYFLYSDTTMVVSGDHLDNSNCTGWSGFLLAKFNSVGNFQWANTILNSISDLGHSVVTDNAGNIYVDAVVSNSPGSALIDTLLIYPPHPTNSLLLKYDPNGQIIWHKYLGQGNNIITDLAISKQGHIYAGGTFKYSTLTLDNITLNNPGGNNLYSEPLVFKLGGNANQSLGLQNISKINSFLVYPNPTSHQISIHPLDQQYSYNARLVDLQGKTLHEWKSLKGNNSLQLNGIANGIYSLELKNKLGIQVKQLVIQK